MLSLMILPIILACNGSVIAQNGYDYGHPYEWADPQANINNPKSVSPKNWTPAPERRSFQALLRDVVTERQAFFGLPLGVLAGVGGVSCLLKQIFQSDISTTEQSIIVRPNEIWGSNPF